MKYRLIQKVVLHYTSLYYLINTETHEGDALL